MVRGIEEMGGVRWHVRNVSSFLAGLWLHSAPSDTAIAHQLQPIARLSVRTLRRSRSTYRQSTSTFVSDRKAGNETRNQNGDDLAAAAGGAAACASASDGSSADDSGERRFCCLARTPTGERLAMDELSRRGFEAQLSDRKEHVLLVRAGDSAPKPVQVKTVHSTPWYVRRARFDGRRADQVTVYVLLRLERGVKSARYLWER